MRLYVTGRSYPEIRELDHSLIGRSWLWVRAFASAARDGAFWAVVAVHLALLAAAVGVTWLIIARVTMPAHLLWLEPLAALAIAVPLCIPSMLVIVTIGGDVMRAHLRRVDPVARAACPQCGYDLGDRLIGGRHTDEGDETGETGETGETDEADEPDAAHGTDGADDAPEPVDAARPASIACPECGSIVPRSVTEPPYRIPQRFRACPWPPDPAPPSPPTRGPSGSDAPESHGAPDAPPAHEDAAERRPPGSGDVGGGGGSAAA